MVYLGTFHVLVVSWEVCGDELASSFSSQWDLLPDKDNPVKSGRPGMLCEANLDI